MRRFAVSALGACALLVGSCGGTRPARLPDDVAGIASPALEGAPVHTLDVQDDRVHVLLFVMTDCPIANSYAPEIRAIVEEYGGERMRFFLVHVDPWVTPEEVATHTEEYGHGGMTVVRDPEHRLVAAVGATVTPEVAVVTTDGVAYRGRIDDVYGALGRKRPTAAQRRELRDALAALRSGHAVEVSRTEPVGCLIPER